jgi:TatD DNase family protein
MFTDTHCHLDFNKFDEDREAVLLRAMDAGVTRILIPALDYESSVSTVKLAESHANLFAAAGFHPTDVAKMKSNSIENLRNLMLPHPNPSPGGKATQGEGKIVAIGEIGLDYYWVKEAEKRTAQRDALRQQLQLAREMNKPAIIHMREEQDAWFGQASVDLLEILGEWHDELRAENHPLAEKPGVLHSFNGNLETAEKAIAMNFYIGVTGPVTYKNAEEKRSIIKQLPLTKLLIETDAPFLTPVPHRGKRNEPAFVVHIADKIAQVHTKSLEQVAEITTKNADQLFGWGG